MQRLLAAADWDADAVRDDVREYVIEHVGDPDGVLVVDETGFLRQIVACPIRTLTEARLAAPWARSAEDRI